MDFLKKYKKYIILFSMLLLLSFFFPFSCDDFYWGSKSLSFSTIKEIYNDLFLNGRWLGNFFAILISHNHLIKALVISSVCALLIYIIDKHEKMSLWIFLVLIFLMPINKFSQVIIWGSGFSNYMISTFLFISVYYLVKKYYKKTNSKWYEKIGLFIVTLLNSLVVENITVGTLMVLFVCNLIYFIKNKKVNINLIIMFIGTIIGAVMMFIHPSYLNLLFGTTINDRYIPQSSRSLIKTIKNNLFIQMFNLLINSNILLNGFTMFVFSYLYLKKKIKNIKVLISFYLLTIMIIIGCLFKFNIYFMFVIDILYLINYFYLIYMACKFEKSIWEIILLMVSVILPLVFIQPIGSRLFFLPYVLQIILLFRILDYNNVVIKDYVWLKVIVVIIYILLLYMNIKNYKCEIERDNYIKNNLDRKLIVIDDFKYSKYIWSGGIDSNYFGRYYNLYHGYDENIRYIVREGMNND